jgi:hypothetical protein
MRPLVLAGAAILLAAAAACSRERNAWAEYDVCFIEDAPGATTRHRQFTPVRCSNRAERLGGPVGADHGRLRFEDVDKDGRTEAVVESSALKCRTAATPCYDAYRYVMDYQADRRPAVRVRSQTFLPELSEATR